MPAANHTTVDTAWVGRLPAWLRRWLLLRLTGLHRCSEDALVWRAVLVNLAPKILEALREERWNAVLLTQSLSAAWLPFLPASLARCLYFLDVRSDYLQRAPLPPAPPALRRVRAEERTAMSGIEGAAFVSELDRERACRLLPAAKATAVAPICLDLDYFDFRPPVAETGPVVLFTGHLSHSPNVDAIQYFLAEIWPRITSVRPDARLRIVGLHPAPEVAAAAAGAPSVELLPNVPNIRPYFRAARVYVVPMRFGGGVRQKILEAWALGLPVVTTTMGAEGIAAEDGRNCWLRDDPAGFATQVLALLNSPPAVAVATAARHRVETDHAPGVSGSRLASLLQTATARRRTAPPRVLLDLRWLEPGRVGGVEQMTRALIDGLAKGDHTGEYRLLGPARACRWRRFPAGFRHRTFLTDGRPARWHAWRHAAIDQLTGSLALPALTGPAARALETYTRLDFTVVHGLASYVHPDLRRFPSVVTMHDLQHLHFPEFFSPADSTTREREYRESCRLADHIICVSEFTRQDVHRRYAIPLGKMSVVWNLPPTTDAMTASDAAGRLRRLGINPPYLFYPAQPWRHKNHHGLLEALRLAAADRPPAMQLILTGQPFPPDHPAATLLHDPALRGRVRHLGYRPAADIAALYHSATALVFPSLFEGFGMPLLEAMRHGCPVVCGTHTALPEIAGDAALFTDVTQPEALAEAITTIVRDAGLRQRLRQAGTDNLRRFDRRALVAQTVSIYHTVHQRHFS